jgi:DNA-binding transcriptional LysR family regulator
MNDVNRPELRHLRAFVTVADELHFGRAAERLAVSQPALSVQIRQLERVVGASLFDRHNRRVVLTATGRLLDDSARRLLRDADLMLETARAMATGQGGILRVGFGPTMMLSTLAPVVRAFRSRAPGVRVDLREMVTADQVSALLRDDLDIGFVRGVDPDPRLQSEAVAREPLRMALPRDHRLAGRARVPLRALADEPWVLFPRAIAPQLHAQVLRLCDAAGFAPRVVQESREVSTTIGLVGAGVGVTIVPAAVQRMSWPDVVYRHLPRAHIAISAVWRAGDVPPTVEALLALVRARPRH